MTGVVLLCGLPLIVLMMLSVVQKLPYVLVMVWSLHALGRFVSCSMLVPLPGSSFLATVVIIP